MEQVKKMIYSSNFFLSLICFANREQYLNSDLSRPEFFERGAEMFFFYKNS